MKIFLLLLSFSVQILFAQNDSLKKTLVDEPIYGAWVESMPEPIGGMEAIQSNILYPTEAVINQIEGKVYVFALIDTLGYPIDVRIIKGIGYGCDEAALSAIKNLRFKPATTRNKKVSCPVSIPVVFKLSTKY